MKQECINQEKEYQLLQIGPLHDPVTWYKISYAEPQNRQWDTPTRQASPSLFWKSHCVTWGPTSLTLYCVINRSPDQTEPAIFKLLYVIDCVTAFEVLSSTKYDSCSLTGKVDRLIPSRWSDSTNSLPCFSFWERGGLH